jgi:hypothetical protein
MRKRDTLAKLNGKRGVIFVKHIIVDHFTRFFKKFMVPPRPAVGVSVALYPLVHSLKV